MAEPATSSILVRSRSMVPSALVPCPRYVNDRQAVGEARRYGVGQESIPVNIADYLDARCAAAHEEPVLVPEFAFVSAFRRRDVDVGAGLPGQARRRRAPQSGDNRNRETRFVSLDMFLLLLTWPGKRLDIRLAYMNATPSMPGVPPPTPPCRSMRRECCL